MKADADLRLHRLRQLQLRVAAASALAFVFGATCSAVVEDRVRPTDVALIASRDGGATRETVLVEVLFRELRGARDHRPTGRIAGAGPDTVRMLQAFDRRRPRSEVRPQTR